jgi:hypothetical protein
MPQSPLFFCFSLAIKSFQHQSMKRFGVKRSIFDSMVINSAGIDIKIVAVLATEHSRVFDTGHEHCVFSPTTKM